MELVRHNLYPLLNASETKVRSNYRLMQSPEAMFTILFEFLKQSN